MTTHEDYEGPGYHPLFVNWRSDFLHSYTHQIGRVRQGDEIGKVEGFLTAPLLFVSDLAQALARIPSTWYKYTRRLLLSKVFEDVVVCDEEATSSERKRESIVCEYHERDWAERAPRVARFVPSMPFQYLWSLPTDSFGKTAWINMLRRTEFIMRHPREFDAFHVHQLDTEYAAIAVGGKPNRFNGLSHMAQFFRELERRIDEHQFVSPKEPIEITLIGHSMGTIVINEVLRAFPDLPYRKIVYLAAAYSIKDFSQSVIPVLLKSKLDNIHFYNLSLDVHAEAREYTVGGFGPTGSLLEWIDAYYTDPPTVIDRTMGKWQNVSVVRRQFPEAARKRMTFKTFAFDTDNQPIRHGEMDDLERCYWRDPYWANRARGKPDIPDDATLYDLENCWYKDEEERSGG